VTDARLTATPWWRSLYAQVLAAIVFGGLLGHFNPDIAVELKPLGDAFIKLVKMVIGPVIFITVTSGIAGMSSLASLGSTTGKALLYFLSFRPSHLLSAWSSLILFGQARGWASTRRPWIPK